MAAVACFSRVCYGSQPFHNSTVLLLLLLLLLLHNRHRALKNSVRQLADAENPIMPGRRKGAHQQVSTIRQQDTITARRCLAN